MAHHRDAPTAQLGRSSGSAPAGFDRDHFASKPPVPIPDPSRPSDAALVSLALRDPLAFAPLYQRYVTSVYRYCYRQTSDPDIATDLTAQIFPRTLEALPKFRILESNTPGGGTFRSWLFEIAHNAVIDARRRHRPSVSLDDRHPQLADDDRGPRRRGRRRTTPDQRARS